MIFLKENVNKFKEIIFNNCCVNDYLNNLKSYIGLNFRDKKCVINITGDLESLVAFKLLESALGRENIYPVYVPYKNIAGVNDYFIDKFFFNSKENLEEAKNWIKKFGYTIVHSKDKGVNYTGDFYLAKYDKLEDQNTMIIPDICTLVISPKVFINPLFFRLNMNDSDFNGDQSPYKLIPMDPLVYEKAEINDFYVKYVGKENVLRFSLNSKAKYNLFFKSNNYINGDYDINRIFDPDNKVYCEEVQKNLVNFIDVEPADYSSATSADFLLDREQDLKFLKRMKINILQYVADSVNGILINPRSLTKKVLNIGQFESGEDFMPFANLTSHEVALIGFALGIPENYLFSNFNLDDIDLYENSIITKDIFKLDLKIKSFVNIESPLVNLPAELINQLRLVAMEDNKQ